jgi:hypothetical protein
MLWFSKLLSAFSAAAPAFEPPLIRPAPGPLALGMVQAAREELGRGESGANNAGPDVVRFRGGIDDGGAWCADFVSHCLERSAARLGVDVTGLRSRGAKRLYRRLGKLGSFETVPTVGDVACWHRGAQGAGTGHVGIVIAVDGVSFVTIEGNRGGFPSLVREYQHELGEALLLGFARLGR